MKAVFEKIKERLEEASWNTMSTFDEDGYSNDDSEEVITLDKAIEIVNQVESEYNNGWIPFKQREMTEEEKEVYGEDCKYMLDCKLPEEDEEILVTHKWKDEFYVDHDIFMKDGSACYLESGREFIDEAIAWRSLPAPYKGE